MVTNGLTNMTTKQILSIIIIIFLSTTVLFGYQHYQILNENRELIKVLDRQDEVIIEQRSNNEKLIKQLKRSVNLTEDFSSALDRCVDELDSK